MAAGLLEDGHGLGNSVCTGRPSRDDGGDWYVNRAATAWGATVADRTAGAATAALCVPPGALPRADRAADAIHRRAAAGHPRAAGAMTARVAVALIPESPTEAPQTGTPQSRAPRTGSPGTGAPRPAPERIHNLGPA